MFFNFNFSNEIYFDESFRRFTWVEVSVGYSIFIACIYYEDDGSLSVEWDEEVDIIIPQFYDRYQKDAEKALLKQHDEWLDLLENEI